MYGVILCGKYLLMWIGESIVYLYLCMDGVWFVYCVGERWKYFVFKVCVIIGMVDWEVVGVDIVEVEVVFIWEED